MTAIGLVLSAGGATGDPWHAGVLAALHETTGWDARHASLIIGTSAGAISATGLRAGLSPADRHADHVGRPVSVEGQTILDRIVTPWLDERADRELRPQSLAMTLRSAWPPWRFRPVHAAVGLLPAGTLSAERLEIRMNELAGANWPAEPTWVPAVRLDDGRRVVFGRDDVDASIGQAVRASCSVPGVYQPAPIGSGRYVDGGVHSSTNADLVAPLAFDLVIISSSMTAVPSSTGLTSVSPTRNWMARKLGHEVAAIRRTGTPVLVVQPTDEALEVIDREPSDDYRRDVTEVAHRTTISRLGHHDGRGLASLMASASG